MKTLDINEFRKIANPHTGLVPLKVVKGFAPHDQDTVAGFPPEQALKLIQSGHGELLDTNMQAQVAQQVKLEQTRSPAVTSAEIGEGGAKQERVEIPADWKAMHPLKRIALAKQLAGEYVVPNDVKPTEYADTLIENEEKRRAEAEAGETE